MTPRHFKVSAFIYLVIAGITILVLSNTDRAAMLCLGFVILGNIQFCTGVILRKMESQSGGDTAAIDARNRVLEEAAQTAEEYTRSACRGDTFVLQGAMGIGTGIAMAIRKTKSGGLHG